MGGGVKRKRRTGRLPASVQAAWGLHPRPAKGPRPGLSLPQIVAAAMTIASSEDLAAVSMSRVAAELGVATMSLYRYVGAKDELLALMMDAALHDLPEAASPAEHWRPALARWARANLAVLHRHPWVVRIPVGGPPIMPNQVAWFERGLGCLRGTTLSEPEKLSALLLVSGYVRHEALLAADLLSGARAAGISMQDVMRLYKTQLSSLIDPERFPALCAMVGAGVFDGIDEPDVDFDFGLERILDGLAARMQGPARDVG